MNFERISAGLRHLLAVAVAIAFLALCGAAFGQEVERTIDLPLPPHVLKQCNEGGGCMLVTRRQVEREIAQEADRLVEEAADRARNDGFVAGYLKGAIEAAQRMVRSQ